MRVGWNVASLFYIYNHIYSFLLSILSSKGNCLMQRAARAGNEAASLFLATHAAEVNHVNKWVC